MNYTANIESLRRNFPDGFAVPELLLEFAHRIRDKRNGSLGDFYLEGDRFNDFWIENGADLHPHFAFFMRDPAGGQIGYWLHDGLKTASPPIVFIGSEGELQVLSDTLEAFLLHLIQGDTGLCDLDAREGDANHNADLKRWISDIATGAVSRTSTSCPDLSRWMEEWGRTQRDKINNNPAYLQIADALRKFVKPNAKPWECAHFDVLLVGTQFRMWHRVSGPKPMPKDEVSGLESLFHSVRQKRAQEFPDRGLWFTASVKVGLHGGASLYCNFLDEPKILNERSEVPTNDYERDLREFPRTKHWMPEWLEQRLYH